MKVSLFSQLVQPKLLKLLIDKSMKSTELHLFTAFIIHLIEIQ